MVPLSLMARLLDAVRPAARLVLVGDPDQLASVEAGAVLGDLVAAPALASSVVVLGHSWRFGGAIADLAKAVQVGDADAALAILRSGDPAVEFVADDELDGLRVDVVGTAAALSDAARAGDVPAALAGLERHRLLCAHRRGPYGVARWTAQVESWLPRDPAEGEWYPGRPLLVTANDYDVGLHNGDTGVVVAAADGVRAAFARGGEPVLLPPSRLSTVQTVHAMTVHRGQGSQFQRVSLILPPADSPLLTRELLYTAITRARSGLRVLGTPEAVRVAVERPITRASGLRRRLTSGA
jgi:exodeoxyribonuclease V alpha subunit